MQSRPGSGAASHVRIKYWLRHRSRRFLAPDVFPPNHYHPTTDQPISPTPRYTSLSTMAFKRKHDHDDAQDAQTVSPTRRDVCRAKVQR
jgi:hypothetical protein